MLSTHFLTVEVSLEPSLAALQRSILTHLQQQGDPLRWAIVSVDAARQVAIVEAVITTADFHIPPSSVRTV